MGAPEYRLLGTGYAAVAKPSRCTDGVGFDGLATVITAAEMTEAVLRETSARARPTVFPPQTAGEPGSGAGRSRSRPASPGVHGSRKRYIGNRTA